MSDFQKLVDSHDDFVENLFRLRASKRTAAEQLALYEDNQPPVPTLTPEEYREARAEGHEFEDEDEDYDEDEDEDEDSTCSVCGEEPHDCECTDEELELGVAS